MRFERTVEASGVPFRVLIGPTPIVVPGRANKNANHANRGFTHAGNDNSSRKAVPSGFVTIFNQSKITNNTMKAIRVRQHGGPEVLSYEDAPDPSPAPDQAVVKIDAAGVNFIDIYFRSGLYKTDLPFTNGQEAAGVVTAVGSDVSDLQAGDRVAYAGVAGSYAEYAAVPAARLVKLPEGVDTRNAAAVMLQGMTVHYLTHSTFPLEPGHTALVHAAAGGVGLLLVQVAKMRGARVIGTCSTQEKAAKVREAGADEVILYTEQDFETEVKRITEGEGVHVVYDPWRNCSSFSECDIVLGSKLGGRGALWASRKVRASQDGVLDNVKAGQPDGKWNRKYTAYVRFYGSGRQG